MRYPFHCTRIADGSRTIAVKTAVEFELVPGQLGRWEAADITPELTKRSSPLSVRLATSTRRWIWRTTGAPSRASGIGGLRERGDAEPNGLSSPLDDERFFAGLRVTEDGPVSESKPVGLVYDHDDAACRERVDADEGECERDRWCRPRAARPSGTTVTPAPRWAAHARSPLHRALRRSRRRRRA